MVFSSVIFIYIFLPAVLLGYYILPRKLRNGFLLVASLVFYACGGLKHLIYLVASILINYLFGIAVAKTAVPSDPADDGRSASVHTALQRAAVIAAVVINIGSLVYFKYTGMLITTFNELLGRNASIPDMILPLGISFYTFQCLSYIIDVYRTEGVRLPDGSRASVYTKDPVKFALFISMFPQLLQGPIIRYSDVKDTLEAPVITLDGFAYGIGRFIIGLAKKAVIANTLGQVCDSVFEIPCENMQMGMAWLGAVLYTLQIYFDFSGYTDMAIGIGHMFGFRFRENFNYPYISRSVTEFWRRWHISLSNWFRDYLYIPLGGSRRGNVYVNLIIVFLATGIWHGAAWGFLVWGMWHGLFMLIERWASKRSFHTALPAPVSSALKWLYTTLVVMLGWMLFKIEEIPAALSYFKVMFGLEHHVYNAFSVGFFLDARITFFIIIAVAACIPWAQVLPGKAGVWVACLAESKSVMPRVIRRAYLLALFVICYIFIVNTTYTPFIYFKF